MKLRGVIIAAGYGTRFLPVTKTVPKEMLPLIDRPVIDLVVQEMVDSGIEEILIISSRRKKAMEDYFDREVELETVFSREKKQEALNRIAPPRARFFFARQQEMKGTGQALMLAKSFAGDQPFIVAYPDDLFLAETPLSRQLAEAHRRCGHSVLAVQATPGDISRFGIVEPAGAGHPCPIRRLVEKPAPGTEPSRLVAYGRYLFTPDLFPLLERGWRAHQAGEYYHVEAINGLASRGQLYAHAFEGLRLDTGAPAAYLESICRYALTRKDLAARAKRLFKELADEES